MKMYSFLTRTTLFCFLFVCFFVAQNVLAVPATDAELYYIVAMKNEGGYANELRALDMDDLSNERAVGDLNLDSNQIALSATVDPENGDVYFANLTLDEGAISYLAKLDMKTLGVKNIGELSQSGEKGEKFDLIASIAFDDEGQLYGLGMNEGDDSLEMSFYQIDKMTGEKKEIARYDEFNFRGEVVPFAFNKDDGLFYFIIDSVGIGAIDPSNPEELQEVGPWNIGEDNVIFAFTHKSGSIFYAPIMTEVVGNALADLDVNDLDVKSYEVLDGVGMPVSIFYWPIELIEIVEDDDSNDEYEKCKKEHGNSAYKKAYQRVKYYKKHDHDLYLALQAVYDTYRLSGDKIRKTLKQENVLTYDKYKQYHRYKKYKECKKFK